MSKTLHVFCNILQYIKSTEPALANVIDDLCLGAALKPRGGRGVTFLMPPKNSIETLEKLASSESVDDHDKAVNLLKAHILTDEFKTASDFADDNKSVVNKLGYVVEVDVKGSKVSIGSSLLTPDSKFKSSANNNLAVWRIAGVPPVEGSKFSAAEHGKKRREKKGGMECFTKGGIRKGLADKLKREYLQAFNPDYKDSTKYDPYASVIVNIAHYLHHRYTKDGNQSNLHLLHGMLLRLHPLPVATFFDWFEPYTNRSENSNDFFIPTDVLYDWWNNAASQVVVSYDLYENLAHKLLPSDMTSSSNDVHNKLSEVKTKLLGYNVTDIASRLGVAYQKLSENGTIGGTAQVVPKGLSQYCAHFTPEYLQFSDERAFMLSFGVMEALVLVSKSNGISNVTTAKELESIINDISVSYPGNDYIRETLSANNPDSKLKENGFAALHSNIHCFIISDHFLTISHLWCGKDHAATLQAPSDGDEPFVYTAAHECTKMKQVFVSTFNKDSYGYILDLLTE